MKKYVIIAFVAFTGLFSAKASAQSKVAHINASDLIEVMPEAKKAQTDLDAYAQGMEKERGALIEEYNKKMQDFDKASQATPPLSDAMKEIKIKEIQEAQKRIQDYEQIARQKINDKQNELMKPILDKARKAIEDTAKEKGYTYVIDNSNGLLLVAPAGDDLLPAVKTKLNIK